MPCLTSSDKYGRGAQAGKTSNCLPGCCSGAHWFVPICLLSCPPTDLTIILMPICLIVGFSIPPLLSEILQEFQFGIRLSFQGIRFSGLPFFPPIMPAKSLRAEAQAEWDTALLGTNIIKCHLASQTGSPFQINVHCISSAAASQIQRGTISANATTPENVPIKVLLNTPVMPSLLCEDVWTFFQLSPVSTTQILRHCTVNTPYASRKKLESSVWFLDLKRIPLSFMK